MHSGGQSCNLQHGQAAVGAGFGLRTSSSTRQHAVNLTVNIFPLFRGEWLVERVLLKNNHTLVMQPLQGANALVFVYHSSICQISHGSGIQICHSYWTIEHHSL